MWHRSRRAAASSSRLTWGSDHDDSHEDVACRPGDRPPGGGSLLVRYCEPEHSEYHLTPQEAELLKLLIEGHHKKTAAREMKISVNTVSFHLKNIYQKLQVHSKTEAVAKALREHLI